jgi:outer membrane protein assembly factor BamB
VSASDGKLLWKVEISGYRTAVIPTPIIQGNIVYVTAGYNAGCNAIRLTRAGNTFNTAIIYANNVMINQHGGVVLMNNHIFGFTDGLGFTCQNFSTGELVWRERNSDIIKGATLGVNDRLILLDERAGLIAVAAADPSGWRTFGKMELPERTQIETRTNMVWAHPVVANGKLYIRDQDLLFCFRLR